MSPPPRLIPFFLAAALIALADQAIKQVVVARFDLGESLPLIPGFLSLTYVRNRGGAFGLLAGVPPLWGRVFFVAATLAALAFVLYLYRWSASTGRWGRLGLVLVAGGGLGNLVDRLAHGEVIDFVDVFYRGYHWPAFNLADSGITVGVALLALEIFRGPASGRPEEDEAGGG